MHARAFEFPFLLGSLNLARAVLCGCPSPVTQRCYYPAFFLAYHPYGNGPTRWVRCTRWPYAMGPLYTVALYDGSVVYTVALYDGSVVHGGPLRPRARMVQIAGSVRASVCVCAGGGGVWVFVWASVRASVCGLVCGLVRYTPQPSRGGAVPCRRHRAVRCCLGL